MFIASGARGTALSLDWLLFAARQGFLRRQGVELMWETSTEEHRGMIVDVNLER